jgi:hypothetical protein
LESYIQIRDPLNFRNTWAARTPFLVENRDVLKFSIFLSEITPETF